MELAKAAKALSPSAQQEHPIYSEQGIDIILGGHDHLYYISRGVSSWEGYDTSTPVLGAERDQGDVLVIKSGTDFRDLSELTLELADAPPGSVRKKVIKAIHGQSLGDSAYFYLSDISQGKHHETKPGSRKSDRIEKLLKTVLSSVDSAMKEPLCMTAVEMDMRSTIIRTQEVAII